ncbi:MAG TPA: hypothetical protein VI643_07730, partial [Planctomycetota bacterium]|nr:hypothetical protein [Planctomycetota bacterium]
MTPLISTLRALGFALLALALASVSARGAQDPPPQPTVTLLGKLNPRPPSPYFNGTSGWFYSAVAGYSAGGREYALIQTGGLGVSGSGVSIIDVTNPAAPVEVVYLPLSGDRHEKQLVVHGNHAYACGEEGAGLAI